MQKILIDITFIFLKRVQSVKEPFVFRIHPQGSSISSQLTLAQLTNNFTLFHCCECRISHSNQTGSLLLHALVVVRSRAAALSHALINMSCDSLIISIWESSGKDKRAILRFLLRHTIFFIIDTQTRKHGAIIGL